LSVSSHFNRSIRLDAERQQPVSSHCRMWGVRRWL